MDEVININNRKAKNLVATIRKSTKRIFSHFFSLEFNEFCAFASPFSIFEWFMMSGRSISVFYDKFFWLRIQMYAANHFELLPLFLVKKSTSFILLTGKYQSKMSKTLYIAYYNYPYHSISSSLKFNLAAK